MSARGLLRARTTAPAARATGRPKAPALGVRAVMARGFERIHRSNLIGMGVLPCQFEQGTTAKTLRLDGSERFDLELAGELSPRQSAALHITRSDGQRESISVLVRIDTPIEVAYYRAGGILPYVLDRLLEGSREPRAAM